MKLWLDAVAVMFQAAREPNAVVMTKDRDFIRMRDDLLGPPPQVIWLRVGNSSNAAGTGAAGPG